MLLCVCVWYTPQCLPAVVSIMVLSVGRQRKPRSVSLCWMCKSACLSSCLLSGLIQSSPPSRSTPSPFYKCCLLACWKAHNLLHTLHHLVEVTGGRSMTEYSWAWLGGVLEEYCCKTTGCSSLHPVCIVYVLILVPQVVLPSVTY
jgi:hypothetical protein